MNYYRYIYLLITIGIYAYELLSVYLPMNYYQYISITPIVGIVDTCGSYLTIATVVAYYVHSLV